MTERKFTDEEVIKALECCSKDNVKDCDACPYEDMETKTYCVNELIKDALDLINRQKEQIEELRKGFKADADYFANEYDSYIRAEAIKEFAKRLKYRYRVVEISSGGFIPAVILKDIDNLVKEMTEEL